MNRLHKLLLASLALSLLLSACSPVPSGSPAPGVPAMPSPTQDGGLPPREGADPIDVWRNRHLFENTQVVIPQKAINYPVLIAEHLELDWDTLKEYAAAQVPDGVKWTERTGMSATLNTSTRKGRPHWYTFLSDTYETDVGLEATSFHESILETRYYYHKRLEEAPSLEEGRGGLCSEQEAVEILRSALFEWGVPAEELELQFVAEYDMAQGLMSDHPQYFYIKNTYIRQEDWAGYLVRFRHMLYDIPVLDQAHWVRENLEDPEGPFRLFAGQYAYGVVTGLGLRTVWLHFRRVVEVEHHDVPIIPISTAIDQNYDMIRYLFAAGMHPGPVARIELMLAPTYYEGEDMDTRVRLTPAWCFFDERETLRAVIDASTAKTIRPTQKQWEFLRSH